MSEGLAGLFCGLILGLIIAAKANVTSNESDVKAGYIKLNGKFYQLRELPEQPNE